MYAQLNRFTLAMTKKEAKYASHSGSCDNDVEYLVNTDKIRRALNAIDKDAIRAELWEYGAWSDDELDDHEANKRRIVWIAAGYINDEIAQRKQRGYHD